MQLSSLALALTRAGLMSSSVAFSPSSLFAAGEQGVYFDPNNSTTLFEDAAGTIPTALERPVGLMRDLSGRGNHATSSSTARPTLTRRVNLLTNTEDFSKSAWVKNATTISGTIYNSPNNTTTANLLIEQAITNTHYLASSVSPVISGAKYVFNVFLKKGIGSSAPDIIQLSWGSGGFNSNVYVNFNIALGTVPSIGGGVSSASIKNVGNGWYLCAMEAFASSTTNTSLNIFFVNNSQSATRAPSYLGSVTTDVLVWGADLRPTNFGVGLPAYQRVGDTAINAADYDTYGFPAWLRCSGGQSMVTPSIDFTGTDKMTVWAGLRKLSDATIGTILEVGNLGTITNGVSITAPQATATGNYGFQSGGSSLVSVAGATYASPISNVLVGIGDVSGPNATLRANGTQIATSGASQGSGNYGNYPLYLFARNQSSLFFNGLAGPIIVRGAQSSAAEIANAENWINAQQKVY